MRARKTESESGVRESSVEERYRTPIVAAEVNPISEPERGGAETWRYRTMGSVCVPFPIYLQTLSSVVESVEAV